MSPTVQRRFGFRHVTRVAQFPVPESDTLVDRLDQRRTFMPFVARVAAQRTPPHRLVAGLGSHYNPGRTTAPPGTLHSGGQPGLLTETFGSGANPRRRRKWG